ncbi:MAG: hypothetical protein ABEJ65_08335, partial [bacterium]
LGGVVLCHGIVGIWLWGVLRVISTEEITSMVMKQMFSRGEGQNITGWLKQFFTYPLMVVLSMAPWTLIYCTASGVTRIKELCSQYDNESLSTLALCGIAPFLVLWFLPLNSTRYALPVFPWIGVLTGFTVEGLIEEDCLIPVVRGINYFLGGLLTLMVLLPWMLDTEHGLLPFNVLLSGTAALVVTGLLMLGLNHWKHDSLYDLIGITLTFVIAVKMGYLFIYTPMEKPERLTTRPRIKRFAREIKETGKFPVQYTSNSLLEVPFYLKQKGIAIEKQENFSELDPDRIVITLQKGRINDRWITKWYMRPSRDNTVYVFIPRKL